MSSLPSADVTPRAGGRRDHAGDGRDPGTMINPNENHVSDIVPSMTDDASITTVHDRLLSQLAHVELITPKPADSLAFFVEVLGLELTEQAGTSAYLRGWGENFHHSLKLTEGPEPALGHIGWRASGPEALESAADRLNDLGHGDGWIDGDVGHGRAYRYRGPGGQVEEV